MGCSCKNSSINSVSGNTVTTSSVQATYSITSFLPPYNGEAYLQIKDVNGIVRHKIYNDTLTVRYVIGNIINMKTASDNKIITLDFTTSDEASDALIKLSDTYNLVRQNY